MKNLLYWTLLFLHKKRALARRLLPLLPASLIAATIIDFDPILDPILNAPAAVPATIIPGGSWGNTLRTSYLKIEKREEKESSLLEGFPFAQKAQ